MFIWTGRHVSLCVVNVIWTFITFIIHFLNKFSISARLVCSFCEATVGSLSMASTAVSLTKVDVVDSGEIDRSAGYMRYNNCPKTLPRGSSD
jgi:hypothetical protein